MIDDDVCNANLPLAVVLRPLSSVALMMMLGSMLVCYTPLAWSRGRNALRTAAGPYGCSCIASHRRRKVVKLPQAAGVPFRTRPSHLGIGAVAAQT